MGNLQIHEGICGNVAWFATLDNPKLLGTSEFDNGVGGWHDQWIHLETWKLQWNYRFHTCSHTWI